MVSGEPVCFTYHSPLKKAWVKWHEETFSTFFVKTAVSDFGKYGRPENIFVELLASVG
jgi:hypothetical protein